MPMTLEAFEGGHAGGGSPREEMTARLEEANALPANEAKLAEQARAALIVTVRPPLYNFSHDTHATTCSQWQQNMSFRGIEVILQHFTAEL